MTVRPISRPPASFQAPMAGSIDERLSVIAQEINRKANAGGAGPSYSFLGLRSPDGTNWRVTVDDTGALHTEAAPRT
jgi:hypothetical protein